jgi:ABC-type lipoprotein export system ATPase subunit
MLEKVSNWAKSQSVDKVMLLMGRAGSGKSTLIALIANHDDGVNVARSGRMHIPQSLIQCFELSTRAIIMSGVLF